MLLSFLCRLVIIFTYEVIELHFAGIMFISTSKPTFVFCQHGVRIAQMFPCSCPAFTHHSFSPFLIFLLSAPLLSLYLNITHQFITSLSVVAEIGDYSSSLQPWMCTCVGVLWRTRGWSQFPALSWVSPETNTTSITTLCSIIVLIATSQSRRQCVCRGVSVGC